VKEDLTLERWLLNRSALYLLLLVTAAAVILSAAYLMLARVFTRIVMHVTLVLSILLNVYVPNGFLASSLMLKC
jgi:hypothetical protein